jgi:diguanylate cyclase (GGDEF)-like protein
VQKGNRTTHQAGVGAGFLESAGSLTCISRFGDNARNHYKQAFAERIRSRVNFWSPKTFKSLVLPGGIFLVAACVVIQGAFGSIPSAAVHFYFYSIFAGGILLAWRFHSSRILFALCTVFLAQRALEFFSSGRSPSAGPGRIALEAVAFLLPLNFIAFSVFRERGLVFPAILPRMALLFIESVFVAIICRPGEIVGPALLHSRFLGRLAWTPVPSLALLAFIAALTVLLVRLVLYRKPTESGLLWALLATFLAFQVGAVGPAATAYLATAGLILISSIIENSYFLAYHDELTSLPARRAFNDALLRLEEPYAAAVVDIDHFKNFNDTYGHETGDQVLRMVAGKLASVTGGGRAYRVGGEEFSILFPGKSAKEVMPHLELLRSVIEVASFRVRGGEERRGTARTQDSGSPDSERKDARSQENQAQEFRSHDRRSSERRVRPRRPPATRKRVRPVTSEPGNQQISVTVSIGAAEPNTRFRSVEHVLQAADQALYRAKQSGRNRVELSSAPRAARPRRNIA